MGSRGGRGNPGELSFVVSARLLGFLPSGGTSLDRLFSSVRHRQLARLSHR